MLAVLLSALLTVFLRNVALAEAVAGNLAFKNSPNFDPIKLTPKSNAPAVMS